MWIELQHSFFSPILSGQERRIHILCEELLRRGFQVSICAPRDGVDKVAPYEGKGPRLFVHPPFFSRKPKSLLDPIIYAGRLKNFLRKRWGIGAPDLVLAFQYTYVAASKRAWPDVPVAFLPGAMIGDWHSWLYGHRSLPARAILRLKRPAQSYVEKEAVRAADQIFIETALLRDRFLRRYPEIEAKIRLWPTPVDTVRFAPFQSRRAEIRERLGVNRATKIILAVGRLQWNKNFSTLIEATAMLRANGWLLLIVGQGSEQGRLLGLVRARGLEGRVRFLGACSEMESLYAGADILAHPALLEPYGNVVLEAMSSGLPCIVSPAGNVGLSGDLTDGTNALFADPRDPGDWANKITRLLDDAVWSAKLGKEARKFCEDRPGWPSLTNKLLEECGFPSREPQVFEPRRGVLVPGEEP